LIACEKIGGEFFLTGRSIEFLDEALKEIKETVEGIADALYKGNGHSLVSRIALIERSVETNTAELEKIRIAIHDSKNRLTVVELKNERLETKIEKSDGKSWGLISTVISVALSIIAAIVIQKILH
jgi:hypothetical protein